MFDKLIVNTDILYKIIELLDIISIYNLKLINHDFKITKVILNKLVNYYLPNIKIIITESQLINWITHKIEVKTKSFKNIFPKFLHRCVKASNNNIYIFGGVHYKNYNIIKTYSDLNKYNLITNELTNIVCNINILQCVGTTLNCYKNNLYLFGGINKNLQFNNDILIFNIITELWTVNDLLIKPPPRWGHTLCNYKNFLILFGGSNQTSNIFNDLWIFDIEKNIWTKKKIDNNLLPRIGHSSIIYENYLYIFGGNNRFNTFNDLWTINLSNFDNLIVQQIKQVNPPKGRIGASFVLIENRIYLYGGRDKIKKISYNDLCIYDIPTKTWKIIDNICPNINGISGHIAYTTDTEIIINGGYINNEDTTNNTFAIKVL